MVNEHFLDLQQPNLVSDVATIVHELLHALFFHPFLFEVYPPNAQNKPFLIREPGRVFLQGTQLVETARAHFGCPSLEKSRE